MKAILGASDPEMELIEQVLRKHGAEIIYAQAGGRRVHAGNAYQADNIPPDADLVIECGPTPTGATIIDHHRPGDPGYGRPPAEYLPASSLGQVLMIINPHRVPEEYKLAAAADHCLAAAYRGECPGVDPDRLMQWRAESRATFQRRPVRDVLADVERARKALRNAPVVALGPDICVRDLRGQHIAELPEAAAREGICFIADLRDKDGRTKIVCQSGSPEQIRAFMEWGPKEGLTGIYGDPTRGFAGGYLGER